MKWIRASAVKACGSCRRVIKAGERHGEFSETLRFVRCAECADRMIGPDTVQVEGDDGITPMPRLFEPAAPASQPTVSVAELAERQAKRFRAALSRQKKT